MAEKQFEYSGGAKRGQMLPYMREIPFSFMRRVGAALTEGKMKYNEANPNTSNWRKGDQEFFADAADHLLNHIFMALAGDTSEDHWGHAGANLAFIIWGEEMGRMIWAKDPDYIARHFLSKETERPEETDVPIPVDELIPEEETEPLVKAALKKIGLNLT